MKDFHELPIWREGYEKLMKIYDLVEHFPSSERFILKEQTIRAALSVIANIAESHGRYYYADKVRVLYTVRGEITELRSHLAVAFGRKYITKDQFVFFNQSYCQLTNDLNLYINSLMSQK